MSEDYMETVHLAPLCGALEVSRTRVEKWISDGLFTPREAVPNGKARRWTKHDALRLACFIRLVDGGLRLEVGKVISRLSALDIFKSEFLVVLAHKKTIWQEVKDGASPIDTREHYDAFVVNREEIKKQLDVPSWTSLLHILINLHDVRNELDRAWSYAASQRSS